MEKLFFVPEGDEFAAWGNTVEDIFDELEVNCDFADDVFICGFLVDTSTMTVKRAEFGFERKRVIDIH